MDPHARLRDLGVDAATLCERWDALRAAAVGYRSSADLDHLRQLLEAQQDELLRNRPVLGATRWFVTEVIEIGDGYFAAIMDDGHIENCAILRLEGEALTAVMESPTEG